ERLAHLRLEALMGFGHLIHLCLDGFGSALSLLGLLSREFHRLPRLLDLLASDLEILPCLGEASGAFLFRGACLIERGSRFVELLVLAPEGKPAKPETGGDKQTRENDPCFAIHAASLPAAPTPGDAKTAKPARTREIGDGSLRNDKAPDTGCDVRRQR